MLASLCRSAVFALDPKKAITQYVHDVWTVEDGLPQNSILAIIQTRDGYLWLGTWQGLVRFDGVRFTVFDRQNTSEIKSNYIYAFCEDRQGNLWIGTWGGLLRFRDGKFTNYTTRDGLSGDAVKAIHEDRQGNLWIGTAGGGLNRFSGGRFTSFTSKDGLASDGVEAIHEDRNGNLWVGTWGGLSRFKDEQLITYTAKEGLPNHAVYSICEGQEGGLWLGASSGLYQFKDGKFTRFSEKEGLAHKSVRSVFQDREGNLWVGTEGGGLNRFQDGKFTQFTTKDGLSHDTVWPIYEDREGSLWVGTWGGLNRFRDGILTVFTTKEGLSHDWTRSVCEDRSGNIWIGGYGGGVNRLKDGRFTHYTKKDGLSGNIVDVIYADREGTLWVNTEDGGLSRFKDGRFTRYGVKEGLPHDLVSAIHEDREGNLWFGFPDGRLSQLKDGKVTVYGPQNGMSRIWLIYEDQKRNFWIALEDKLMLFREGEFIDYPTRYSPFRVTSIYEDRDGNLWMTTRGDGLIRIKDGESVAYTTREGLPDNALTAVLEDGRGNLWLGSFRGIFSVSRRELDDFARGKIRAVAPVTYGKADGMRSVECNSQQPSGWKSKDGRLWFPTIKGLVVVDPDNTKLNTLAPPVSIEQVIFQSRPVDLGQRAELPAGRRELEFHYTALSLLDPKKVRFKYRLEGYDEDWIEAGARRVAYYTGLSPGTYRFRVIACNNDGVWNETGAAFELYLRPHFYETRWFYALCALLSAALLVMAGIGLYHRRVRWLRAREKKLAALVGERTRDLERAKQEVEEINQNLEQRVQEGVKALAEAERMAAYGNMVAGVAHEVHNPLFALQVAAYEMKEMSDGRQEVKSQLDIIERTTERLTSLMDDLLNFARPKPLHLAPADVEEVLKEAVTTYQMEHGSSSPKIELATSAQSADGVKSGLPQIVVDRSRMAQALVNLIENAAKHAKGLSVVTLSAELGRESPSQVCIRVADDGAGIDPKDLPHIFDPFFTAGKGTGLGLPIVQQIIKGHGGTITVESQPASGAVFTITLPIEAQIGEP
ncbi:MAG: two-component regulator propeller domain-containing protein [Blastocatellia bacterium]